MDSGQFFFTRETKPDEGTSANFTFLLGSAGKIVVTVQEFPLFAIFALVLVKNSVPSKILLTMLIDFLKMSKE